MTYANSTFTYIEEEARRETSDIAIGDRPPIRMPVRIRNGGFHPMPLPLLTPEQARAASWSLYSVLVDLHNTLAERGHIDDMVTSHVWGLLRAAVRRASKIEAVAASDSATVHAESDAVAGVGETTAAEASRNPSSPEA